MFGRDNRIREVASETVGAMSPYVERIATDERLRRRLIAAVTAGLVSRQRARRQVGVWGAARRLGSDPVLRAQALEAVSQLQQVRRRMRKKNVRHTTRNVLVFVTAAGVVVVAAVPRLRNSVRGALNGVGRDGFTAPLGDSATCGMIVEEIEVNVPVSTAYNQWTQFEEFPTFMEGVDEVKQLDDTLLHWAVTVAGDKAEWDAKITEQEPDRRIAWESVDGKQNRGSVSFEPAGSAARTRIRLQMSFSPDGAAETVGSATGLAQRRVRSDLERFRELIEGQQHESGAWRGEIRDGKAKAGEPPRAATRASARRTPSAQ